MAARSLAEHYRAHRVAFELALELGCTPREAETEIRRRQARLDWLAAEQRRQAKIEVPLARPAIGPSAEWSAPWMMRD